MGIPISVLGRAIVLLFTGQTLNMLSMFAFLMALGIVVDDAIVIGENIYTHRNMGKSPIQAAIDGAAEVLPSVFSSVATTVIAFLPMLFVTGVMGKFIAVMPAAIIAMLTISLIEATFSLPCHLAHIKLEKDGSRLSGTKQFLRWFSQMPGRGLDWVAERIYQPSFNFLMQYPLIAVSGSIMVLLVTAGAVRSGVVPFDPFPKNDGNQIIAQVIYPMARRRMLRMRALLDSSKRFAESAKRFTRAIWPSLAPMPSQPRQPIHWNPKDRPA